MSLTPKNWNKFQQYKDRNPPWIKLHRALLDDYQFACLHVASKALAPCLWLLASEYPDGCITASYAEIAFRLRMRESDLISALKPLVEQGFFIDASMMLAACKQSGAPERETERETEAEREETSSCAVAVATRPDAFEEFWKSYPKRDGANPKVPARKKFLAACKSGADAQAIIGAVRRFAAEARLKGQVGTPYVPQAMTWLNQQRWSDYTPVASATGPPQPPDPSMPSDAELRAQYEHKPSEPERDPSRPAARVLHEGDGPDRADRPWLRH